MTPQEHRTLKQMRKAVHRNYKTKQDFDRAFDEGCNRTQGKPMSPLAFFGALIVGGLILVGLIQFFGG